MVKENYLNILIKLLCLIITVFLIIIISLGLKENLFLIDGGLLTFIGKYKSFAFLVFIIIQILQVIFPIIPGGASCLAGVILFGPIKGFIYNYIGLSVGSIIVYNISKKIGMPFIKLFFQEKTINKYQKYLNNEKYHKILFWGILIPGLPDDLLCYLSGLSNISYKKFITIILLCKPLTLILYSIGWYYFPEFLNMFI